MQKKVFKSVLMSSAMVVALAPFTTGAGAATSSTVAPAELAQYFGNVNFSSAQNTKVIVQLKEASMIEAKQSGKSQSKANLAKVRNQVISELKGAVKSANVNREYDTVFSGFSVELPANQIPALLALPGVKAVYPNVDYNVTTVGETEETASDAVSPQMFNSAPFIGANKAWETGFTGKGVTVAVIDTGSDYNHPDLKHAYGSYKGWDFVDNDNDPSETPLNDPRGAATQHGSHVSGTIAANGGIKGVAPDAHLLAYRVLGPGGRGSSENVIAGIEKAVQDGADVLNLSLGNSINSPDYATSIALDWAMSEGVVAVTSNGNSGPNNWTVGSPSSSRQAISVGATQLPYNVYNGAITTGGVSYPSAKVQGFPSDDALLAINGKEYQYVYCGFGSPAEVAAAAATVPGGLTGKIALISRGAGIAFVDKATAAKNAGAVGAIIFNNVAGETPDVAGMAIPTIKTTLEDGQKLQAELAKGNNKVKFNISFAKRVGEQMASFSSRGPAYGTWMIKPDVSAPGVNITSTIPTLNPANPHGYGVMQGTSMASPHVAGAAALILQAHPDWNVDDVKAALMNTAEDVIDPATGKVYPHNSQGAGSIRVVDAINTKTLVTPGSHSFGTFYKDKGKQVEKQSFTLKNISSQRQTYTFDAEFGEHSDAIKVMTSSNLSVNGGSTQQVNLNVQVDAGQLDPGYYEGTININTSTGTIKVPTILFIKEPDYPRVTTLGVDTEAGGTYPLYGYFPSGAEEVELFVYTSNSAGAAISYVGDITVLKDVAAGYNNFYNWDGKINGVKLAPGYYNVYAYATKLGVSTLAGTNFQIK